MTVICCTDSSHYDMAGNGSLGEPILQVQLYPKLSLCTTKQPSSLQFLAESSTYLPKTIAGRAATCREPTKPSKAPLGPKCPESWQWQYDMNGSGKKLGQAVDEDS